jgi:hypothetical protein
MPFAGPCFYRKSPQKHRNTALWRALFITDKNRRNLIVWFYQSHDDQILAFGVSCRAVAQVTTIVAR